MIYFDHASATPVSKKVLEAMRPYFSEQFFNPSSAYLPARAVAMDYAAAKDEIAHAIGAKGSDLVITAGATEANNLAFTTLSEDGEALILETEHDSIRRAAPGNRTESIRVDSQGRIILDDLKAKITDRTELISIALVNNELGIIEPLAEVSRLLQEIKLARLKSGSRRPLYLHSDASQALNLLEVNVSRLGVDLLTLNAAKIYGPKGVGALYLSHGVRLHPLTFGGGQERGLRAGTENVPGVIGFATAIKEAKAHLTSHRQKYASWKKLLLSEIQDYQLINRGKTLDNFLVLCFKGLDAERLIFMLEEKGVYLSTGAACAASKGQRSHVLAAIGLSEEEINGSLRLSLGELNDEAQIKAGAKIINEVVAAEKRRIAHA